MNDNFRIAAIGTTDAPMVRMIQDLGSQPRILPVVDLYADASAVAAFAPHLLICEFHPQSPQDLGAIRLLRALLPDLRVLLVVESGCLADLEKSGENDGFALLASPFTGEELESAVERAASPNHVAKGSDYLQFAQGICDEINNPLMSASGHLQLLESSLEELANDRARAQVASIRKGLDRISQTMSKVRDMVRASSDNHIPVPIALSALLAQFEDRCKASELTLEIDSALDLEASGVRGDIDLLTAALHSLGQVCRELGADEQEPVTLNITRSEASLEFRMRVESARLEGWELPRAFEPYHLNLVLRGTALGLDLFLVRLISHAHGGDAVARRLSASSVEFWLTLPGSAPASANT